MQYKKFSNLFVQINQKVIYNRLIIHVNNHMIIYIICDFAGSI
jgi:hypothetical protein